MNTDEFGSTKDAVQQALAQGLFFFRRDLVAVRAIHDVAVEAEETWPLNQALLFMLEKSLQASGASTDQLCEAFEADLARLAQE